MLTEGNVFYNVIFDNLRSHFYGILFSQRFLSGDILGKTLFIFAEDGGCIIQYLRLPFLNFLILAESVTMFLLFDITPHSENVSKSVLFFMAIVAGTSSLYL